MSRTLPLEGLSSRNECTQNKIFYSDGSVLVGKQRGSARVWDTTTRNVRLCYLIKSFYWFIIDKECLIFHLPGKLQSAFPWHMLSHGQGSLARIMPSSTCLGVTAPPAPRQSCAAPLMDLDTCLPTAVPAGQWENPGKCHSWVFWVSSVTETKCSLKWSAKEFIWKHRNKTAFSKRFWKEFPILKKYKEEALTFHQTSRWNIAGGLPSPSRLPSWVGAPLSSCKRIWWLRPGKQRTSAKGFSLKCCIPAKRGL